MWVSVNKISVSDRLYKSSGTDIFLWENLFDIRNSQILLICEKSIPYNFLKKTQ